MVLWQNQGLTSSSRAIHQQSCFATTVRCRAASAAGADESCFNTLSGRAPETGCQDWHSRGHAWPWKGDLAIRCTAPSDSSVSGRCSLPQL